MYMLLDDQLQVKNISRNVSKILKMTPQMFVDKKILIYDLSPNIEQIQNFYTEEFTVLTVP